MPGPFDNINSAEIKDDSILTLEEFIFGSDNQDIFNFDSSGDIPSNQADTKQDTIPTVAFTENNNSANTSYSFQSITPASQTSTSAPLLNTNNLQFAPSFANSNNDAAETKRAEITSCYGRILSKDQKLQTNHTNAFGFFKSSRKSTPLQQLERQMYRTTEEESKTIHDAMLKIMRVIRRNPELVNHISIQAEVDCNPLELAILWDEPKIANELKALGGKARPEYFKLFSELAEEARNSSDSSSSSDSDEDYRTTTPQP